MSRTKSGTLPKLQRHKGSGQARVHIAGRDYWCGKWGSAAATAHYHRLIGEFLHGQGSPPRSEGGTGPVANPIPASQPCSSVSVGPEGVRVDLGTHGGVAPSITVCEIAARYLMHCEIYYRDAGGRRTSSYDGARMAIRALESFFDLPAHQFGPLRLQSMRALLVEQGRPRVTCNRVVKAVRRIFKWSASQELIPVGVSTALATVDPLRANRTTAPELPPVTPVPDGVLEATLKHAPKMVADIARLHRLTGARPGELCIMRPCDIDRTDADVWAYRPMAHKNSWRKEDRVIHIGPKAQAILLPYLNRPAANFCFSPSESESSRRNEQRVRRKSPVQPSQLNRRKPSPRRPAGNHYTTASYRRAIARAAKQAGVEHWFPNQLRHSAATEIRAIFGIEAASTRLGHKSIDVTQVYAERNQKLSHQVAREIG